MKWNSVVECEQLAIRRALSLKISHSRFAFRAKRDSASRLVRLTVNARRGISRECIRSVGSSWLEIQLVAMRVKVHITIYLNSKRRFCEINFAARDTNIECPTVALFCDYFVVASSLSNLKATFFLDEKEDCSSRNFSTLKLCISSRKAYK